MKVCFLLHHVIKLMNKYISFSLTCPNKDQRWTWTWIWIEILQYFKIHMNLDYIWIYNLWYGLGLDFDLIILCLTFAQLSVQFWVYQSLYGKVWFSGITHISRDCTLRWLDWSEAWLWLLVKSAPCVSCKPGAGPQVVIDKIDPPETYESNFIHYNFVQFGTKH